MSAPLSISFSHFGFFVTDMQKMKKFYSDTLGLFVTDEGRFPSGQNLVFLSRDPAEHHQIVLVDGRPADQGFNPINQVSFYVEDLESLRSFYQKLVVEGVDDIQPVTHGNAWSVYFRDPEGNRLEVYTNTPWYVTQPLRKAIDLNLDTGQIYEQTEAMCRALPGFRSRESWQASMQSLMGRG